MQQDHVDRIRRTGGHDTYDLLNGSRARSPPTHRQGNSNKEIAARLFLSVYTVETHRNNILEKLHLRGTADLILYAVRKGISVTRSLLNLYTLP